MRPRSWAVYVKNLMYQLGFKKEFDSSSTNLNTSRRDKVVKEKLGVSWGKFCSDKRFSNTTLSLYNRLGVTFGLQTYLTVSDIQGKDIMSRLRSGSHFLRQNKGGFSGLSRENRVCVICRAEIGDVCYFTLRCKRYNKSRTRFFDKMCRYFS